MQNRFDFNKTSDDKILEGLNSEQKSAVIHKSGPLLIIAGAGTGKTTVITHRIAYIIDKKLAKPSEILALTFTEKAASEMEERVDKLVPYGFTDMWISTFHAFGDRILRDFAIDLGLPANFKVLTQTEQAIFMRENIYAFELKRFRPIANPLNHIEAMLKHFSRLKDELISPNDYVIWAINHKLPHRQSPERRSQITNHKHSEEELIEAEKVLELANAYQRYCDLMIQAGNLDFGDQIFLTYKLLKENKKVLYETRERFKYILVDEYQDTNYAQNEIIKLLAGKDGNITVVGDDDQSIYRFRGASISNILDFKKTYPKMKEIVLTENYRSTQEILDSSYKLIQNNNPDRLEVKDKIDKRLKSKNRGEMPELLYCDTLSCEADTIVHKIKELKTKNKYKYNDFAILVRANSHAEPFIQSLNLAGIPHIFSGASGLFSQPEIKMIVAFLKCLVYTDDNLSFYQLATSELYNISHQTMAELYTEAKRGNRSILKIAEKTNLDNEKDKVDKLIFDIDKYSRRKNDSAGEVLYDYLTEKKYLKKLSSNPNASDEIKIYNIAKFFDRIAQFNHSTEDRGVLNFLNNLELILEVGDEVITSDIDPDIDAVNILTAHAAKGLEWPVVFIANCVADRFPSRKKREPLPIPDELIKERLPEGDYHLEEERRLFYVAATRAKKYLFLTAADDYGGKRVKKLSQFVLELLDQPNKDRLKYKLSPEEKIARFQKTPVKIAKLPNKFKGDLIKLSRQQIDDYYSCPKKFYYAHIIKIPLLENHYLMYGIAIHAALNYYFARKINKQNPTLSQLLSDFDSAFSNIGFITREQEDLRKKSGIETLTKFYQTDQKDKRIPKEVETKFEFSEDGVKVNGRYDLIYKDGGVTEICDFKTSDVKEQKEANKRIKESTQMMIYALAWQEKYDQIPKTTLSFIESGLKGETVFSKDDLKNTKEMILSVADGIKKNNMKATPSQFQCRQCPYQDICPEAII